MWPFLDKGMELVPPNHMKKRDKEGESWVDQNNNYKSGGRIIVKSVLSGFKSQLCCLLAV